MKYLLIFIAVAVVVVSGVPQSQKDKIKAFSRECISVTGVDKELLKQAKEGHFVDDEKLEDFTFCLFKKMGLQDENGEILINVARSQLPAELSEADKDDIVNKCFSKKGVTNGKTALSVYKCYRKNSPVNYASSL